MFMVIIYVLLIIIGAIPLLKTILFIILEERIRKEGISTSGVVTRIHTTRYQRGAATDRVFAQYSSNITGQFHEAFFTALHGKYRVGQNIPVKYLPEKPEKIIVAEKRGYWAMLIFSVLIFLFIIFAVFKIGEMIKARVQP